MYVSVQHKQGEIKHVFRGNVFLTVRDQVENGGIIVCKAKHVELAGGTSHAVSYSMALNSLQDPMSFKHFKIGLDHIFTDVLVHVHVV